MRRLWRWLRQADRVERLQAERAELRERLADAEVERDKLEVDRESLAGLNRLMRSLMTALRDVNASLDERCVELERTR